MKIERQKMKKPYEKPGIIWTEKLEVQAITACLKGPDDGSCGGAIVF